VKGASRRGRQVAEIGAKLAALNKNLLSRRAGHPKTHGAEMANGTSKVPDLSEFWSRSVMTAL
jgi:hypothetical protein